MIWIEFKDDLVIDGLKLEDTSASTLAQQFKAIDFGDYDVLKDTPTSIVINFQMMNLEVIKSGQPSGVIDYLAKPEMMEKFKMKQVLSYDQVGKFVAHNRLEWV